MKYILLLLLLVLSNLAGANIQPADGLWATSDDPAIGSGLMMTTQNGITLVSVFTYDEDGNNAWYIASGQVDDEGVLEAELRQTQNGTHITNDNPATAAFNEVVRNLRLDFLGTQVGSVSIDGSMPKSIQTIHFGVESFTTEQQLLEDGTKYRFPSLDGEWVIGDAESGESYVLDLTNRGNGASPPTPNFSLAFLSNHPSSSSWQIYCPQRIQTIQPYCAVRRDNLNEFPRMQIDLKDLGSQQMTIYQATGESTEKYQAFRLNRDNHLLPNDGHWRSYDDPAVGSGLVMRTQGPFTVVLLYSYDEQGAPTWQIASGVFDENGYFSAELLTPSGGTAIESEVPETAAFSGQAQTLEIQLQGLELATFSINGSTPKTIQNSNFGVELFSTDHQKVNDKSFIYPDQKGSWVLVDEEYTESRISNLQPFDLNWFQSPPDPRLYDARQYDDYGIDDDFSLTLFCTKNLSSGGFVFEVKPYCFGRHFIRPVSGGLKVYYEDIGVKEFRYYFDEETSSNDVTSINRDSKIYYLFKLENN